MKRVLDLDSIVPKVRELLKSDEFAKLDDEKKTAIKLFLDTFDGKVKERF